MSDNKESKVTENQEEEVPHKEPFAVTIPDGESLGIDFDKHEKEQCMVMHAERMLANNEAKLVIKYKDIGAEDFIDKEEVLVFKAGEKEKELEFQFLIDLEPVLEAHGSEFRVDGVFMEDPEEEDSYEYVDEEEEKNEQAGEQAVEEKKE